MIDSEDLYMDSESFDFDSILEEGFCVHSIDEEFEKLPQDVVDYFLQS